MKAHRLARINEVIREVASETILFELRDPRVKMVTVTRAEITADLQQAKVYVSIMGSPSEQRLTLHGLASAAGFIQSRLGDRLKMRYTPILTFVEDLGVKNSIEIARILAEERKAMERDQTIEADEDTDNTPPQSDAADGSAEPHAD